jgi:hypothetical protein
MITAFGGRTLLVGLGKIGMGYDLSANLEEHGAAPDVLEIRTHAMAVMESQSLELLGGVDPSDVARRDFQRAFGRPTWPSLSEYDGPAVDVVVVATPTETHLEVVKQVPFWASITIVVVAVAMLGSMVSVVAVVVVQQVLQMHCCPLLS